MKKITLLGMMMILLFSLSGCYTNVGANYGKLLSISFYDEDGNALEHSMYENPLCIPNDDYIYEEFSQDLNNLNSPRPVKLYYCIEAELNQPIAVHFTIETGNYYKFHSLDIDNVTYQVDRFEITKKGAITTASFMISDLNEFIGFRAISNLVMAFHSDKSIRTYQGSVRPQSHVTIMGFVIREHSHIEE